jgi:hypothetical protein
MVGKMGFGGCHSSISHISHTSQKLVTNITEHLLPILINEFMAIQGRKAEVDYFKKRASYFPGLLIIKQKIT